MTAIAELKMAMIKHVERGNVGPEVLAELQSDIHLFIDIDVMREKS